MIFRTVRGQARQEILGAQVDQAVAQGVHNVTLRSRVCAACARMGQNWLPGFLVAGR